MTLPQNFNAYLHDLADHRSMTLEPAGKRQIQAVCLCGWRSQWVKKPDGAARLWSVAHLKEVQAEVDSHRCASCFKKSEDRLCPDCAELQAIFGPKNLA